MTFTQSEYKKIAIERLRGSSPSNALEKALGKQKFDSLPHKEKFEKARSIVDEALKQVFGI